MVQNLILHVSATTKKCTRVLGSWLYLIGYVMLGILYLTRLGQVRLE